MLAAQLYAELKAFFPSNSVTFFISHFDYYRPESYMPTSQAFVEKASATNDQIDALRHQVPPHFPVGAYALPPWHAPFMCFCPSATAARRRGAYSSGATRSSSRRSRVAAWSK